MAVRGRRGSSGWDIDGFIELCVQGGCDPCGERARASVALAASRRAIGRCLVRAKGEQPSQRGRTRALSAPIIGSAHTQPFHSLRRSNASLPPAPHVSRGCERARGTPQPPFARALNPRSSPPVDGGTSELSGAQSPRCDENIIPARAPDPQTTQRSTSAVVPLRPPPPRRGLFFLPRRARGDRRQCEPHHRRGRQAPRGRRRACRPQRESTVRDRCSIV